LRPGSFAAIIIGVVGASYALDARAADITMPIKAPPVASTNAPASCTNAWDLVTTSCQLSWYGITIYGAIDVGGGWQSHGASSHDTFPAPTSYYIQKMNKSPMWGVAPNAMSQSSIGVKGTEPIGGDFSFVFDWQAGFNPYSFGLANGPGSLYGNVGIPLDRQTTSGDSSRAGQWYNGLGYVGISSPSYGTLTVFRQNALTMDGVIAYDPVGASYAFSPLGFSGITCRQNRGLQILDLVEISCQRRPTPGGRALAIRRIRAEQRLEWRVPDPGRRRHSQLSQRHTVIRRDL
jgi:hypothetical protein